MAYKILSYALFIFYMIVGNCVVLALCKTLDDGMLMTLSSWALILVLDALLWNNFKVSE